jgi:hypothetical protein
VAAADDPERLDDLLGVLGVRAVRVEPLTGDASARRFFRVWRGRADSVVVSLYPPGAEATARHDAVVHLWGLEHGLPIPRLLASAAAGIMSEDLGDEDLETALSLGDPAVKESLLLTLASFQRCSWHDVPNPPFDAAFFRQELAVFESFVPGAQGRREAGFLDTLAERLERHPFRLAHRDFHVHNLLWRANGVWAVDFQDMRGGPDTYDASSLLRERGGSRLLDGQTLPRAVIALACRWELGWEQRLRECAAQRGMKVIGTFLRLASRGKNGYLRWLPEVRSRVLELLEDLDAPRGLSTAVAARHPLEEV